jgi:putative N6-adenine-specific DNA methylase
VPPPVLPLQLETLVICAPGLAPLVADELRALGIVPGTVDDAGVSCSLTLDTLVRANVWLRCASRLVVRLAAGQARHFGDLEALAARVPWRGIVPPGAMVDIRATARKSRLYHTGAIAERVGRVLLAAVPTARLADASTDDEDDDAPAQRILVRLDRDACTISADTSGALLHRRGWRQATAKAPMRETLAAAVLQASGWRPDQPLWDPCCGAGTLVIEAALCATGAAPGGARGFAFVAWPAWATRAARLLQAVQAEARAAVRPVAIGQFTATDRDAGAVAAVRANAARAGVAELIRVEQVAVEDAVTPDGHGWIVSNPPYGKRVHAGGSASPQATSRLASLYATLGARARAAAWELALLTDDAALARAAGLAATPVLRTTNGGLPVGVWATRAPTR